MKRHFYGIVIFFLCLSLCNLFANNNEKEDDTILFANQLMDKIINNKIFNTKEEEYFFGRYGGILGENLYVELGFAKTTNSLENYLCFNKNIKISLLGILLTEKLSPLFKNRRYVTYSLSNKIYTYNHGKEKVPITSSEKYLIIFAISENEKIFEASQNGIMMILALRSKTHDKDSWYIDLIDSFIGNSPLYMLLGYSGKSPSNLTIKQDYLRKVKQAYQNILAASPK